MKTLSITSPAKLVICLTILTLLFRFNFSTAQPNLPQRTNTVRSIQSIHFGSFCVTGGGGGTVTVDAGGFRSATGDILLLNVPPFARPAIFEIKLKQNPTVCFNFEPPYILLTGSSGSIDLNLGPTDKGPNGACFALIPNTGTYLKVGGTLSVNGSSTPGLYSGNFAIRFTQQ